MKARFDKIGYPLYCDAGPYAGQMRVDLTIRLYLSPEEYARYQGSESLQITLNESGGGDLQSGSTAEPSAELPAGDVEAAGDARLAASRPASWEPVSGPLTEAGTHEHGTHLLPAPAAPGEPAPESSAKEYRDDCP
jgi:hypothetical protein